MINQMSQNENTERIKVLVQDDSVVKRNRSKPVELLARVYGHVEHKYQIYQPLFT